MATTTSIDRNKGVNNSASELDSKKKAGNGFDSKLSTDSNRDMYHSMIWTLGIIQCPNHTVIHINNVWQIVFVLLHIIQWKAAKAIEEFSPM